MFGLSAALCCCSYDVIHNQSACALQKGQHQGAKLDEMGN